MKGRFLMGENWIIGEGWRIKNGGVRLWRLWKKVNSIFGLEWCLFLEEIGFGFENKRFGNAFMNF